jgi:hypothetical protein
MSYIVRINCAFSYLYHILIFSVIIGSKITIIFCSSGKKLSSCEKYFLFFIFSFAENCQTLPSVFCRRLEKLRNRRNCQAVICQPSKKLRCPTLYRKLASTHIGNWPLTPNRHIRLKEPFVSVMPTTRLYWLNNPRAMGASFDKVARRRELPSI